MKIQTIKCPNCLAPIKYKEGMVSAKCEYCGNTLILKEEDGEKTIRELNFQGSGAIYTCFVPKGWHAVVGEMGDEESRLAPLVLPVFLSSRKNDQSITFVPYSYHNNVAPLMGGFNNQSTGIHYSKVNIPSLINTRIWSDIETLTEERFQELLPQSYKIKKKKIKDFDDLLTKSCNSFKDQSDAMIKQNLIPTFSSYELELEHNGEKQKGFYLVAALAPEKQEKPTKKEEKSGFMGMLSKGFNALKEQMTPKYWMRCYDCIFINIEDKEMVRMFIENIQFTPLYFKLSQERLMQIQQMINQTNQNVQNARMQMAMDRQASQNRMWNTINQTQNDISDIQHSMYESNSNTMDNVRNGWSEAIREVNSYDTLGGNRVEADLSYDHVYQNNDTFVGVSGGTLDNSDFTELDKHEW